MRLLLSGEGPTDLGHEKPSTGGMAFVPGPMAWVVAPSADVPALINLVAARLQPRSRARAAVASRSDCELAGKPVSMTSTPRSCR